MIMVGKPTADKKFEEGVARSLVQKHFGAE
jgi:hypothetical protein